MSSLAGCNRSLRTFCSDTSTNLVCLCYACELVGLRPKLLGKCRLHSLLPNQEQHVVCLAACLIGTTRLYRFSRTAQCTAPDLQHWPDSLEMASPKHSTGLSDLPVELRLQIYSYLFPSRKTLRGRSRTWLSTNRQLYIEGASTF